MKMNKNITQKKGKKSRFFKVYLPLILALITFTYFGYMFMVHAADIATITVGNTTVNAGSTGNLPILFTPGPIGVSAMYFEITFPSSINYLKILAGDALLNAGKMLSANIQSDGKLKVVIMGLNQTIISSGTIATISYSVPADTVSVLAPILINNIDLSDKDAKTIVGLEINGSVLINGSTLTPTPTPTPTPIPTPIPTPTPSIPPITNGPISCTPIFQSTAINQTVTFTANGGNGSYTWSTSSSAVPSSGSGQTFSTKFTSGGFKVVSVVSGDGQSVGCTVSVLWSTDISTSTPSPSLTPTLTPIPTPSIPPITNGPISCTPIFQSTAINQTVTFTANGGNGSYTWSTSSSAVPSSGSGQTFSTKFTSGGFKVVSVVSGDGQSVGCTVSVEY